jgi:hypothetical protein
MIPVVVDYPLQIRADGELDLLSVEDNPPALGQVADIPGDAIHGGEALARVGIRDAVESTLKLTARKAQLQDKRMGHKYTSAGAMDCLVAV